MNKEQIWINVDKQNLKNKKYQPLSFVLAQDLKQYNSKTQQWEIKRTALQRAMREHFRMDARTIRKMVDVFIDAGLMEEGDTSGTIIIPSAAEGSNNIVMYMDTARYCAQNLSYEVFKTYCVLFKHYREHINFGYVQYYNFNYQDLLEECGYAYHSTNIRKFEEHLMTLRRLGLIDYPTMKDSDIPYRPTYKDDDGHFKTAYIDIYKVNEYSDIQLQSAKSVKQLTQPNKKVQQIASPTANQDFVF